MQHQSQRLPVRHCTLTSCLTRCDHCLCCSLGSLQQQLAAAAKAPSANAPGFAQTLPTMSSGPFQVGHSS